MTAPATPTEHQPLAKVLLRRTVIAVLATAMLLVPAIVLFVITKQPSATYAAMGALVGIFAVMAGGTRIGFITAIVLALLAPLSIVAGLTPFTGAALMAIMALTVGRLARFGLHRATLLVPILLAWPMLGPVPWLPEAKLQRIDELLSRFGYSLAQALDASSNRAPRPSSASPHSLVSNALTHLRYDNHYLVWVAVFFLVGALVPVIILPFVLRKRPAPVLVPNSRRDAVPYTISITVLTSVATYYFLEHPKMAAGSFLIATILVLTQVGTDVQWRRALQRVLGTLGGMALLAGVLAIVGTNSYTEVLGVPMPMTLYAIGVAFGVAAVISKFSPRGWIYFVLITPAAAMLNAFSITQSTHFGEQRVIDNLIGAGLVIAATLITLGFAHFGRGNDTTEDDKALAAEFSPA